MTFSWKIGRISSIDVYVHWSLLILAAFVYARVGATAVVLYTAFFFCILAHEFGHALAARRYCIDTEDITLYPIGGIARLQRIPRTAWPEMVIALAGPAVNLVLALGLGGLILMGGKKGSWGTAWVEALMQLNLGLAGFNLIPMFPMDGGRIFRALLSGRLGRMSATAVAVRLGQGMAIGLALLGLAFGWGGITIVILAAFLFLAATAELAHVRDEERSDMPDRTGLLNVPPGHSWIYQGKGVWQLSPLVVGTDERLGLRRWGAWP